MVLDWEIKGQDVGTTHRIEVGQCTNGRKKWQTWGGKETWCVFMIV